jgi:TolA-binding protein
VSVVDLHPDHLLDKEIRGELDAGERERLEAHIAQCATCRLERQLRDDFAVELERESLPPDVAGLVETLARSPAAAPPAPAPPPARDAAPPMVLVRRSPRRKIVLLVVAATLTLVAGAFASTEAGRRVIAPILGRTEVGTTYVEAPTAEVKQAPRVVARSSAALPAEPLPSSDAPASAEPARTVAAPAALPAAPPAETPATLFEAEAEARRRGEGARVQQLHAQLIARFPQSREAQVSRMMVARMLLDRGDAAGALAGFDAYLRAASGGLREDALAGRATALDRLGRTEEARRAWAELLEQYPSTTYAAHARARVEAPGGD